MRRARWYSGSLSCTSASLLLLLSLRSCAVFWVQSWLSKGNGVTSGRSRLDGGGLTVLVRPGERLIHRLIDTLRRDFPAFPIER